jgi:hypothetical protein
MEQNETPTGVPKRDVVDHSHPLLGYFVYPSAQMVWLLRQRRIARKLCHRLDRHNPYLGFFSHAFADPIAQFLKDCGVEATAP